MIFDQEQNTVPTIEDALQLVGGKADSFEGWKMKGLGLRLVLMGLAEMQALRLSKLAGMVFKVEKILIDEDNIRNLEPKQLFALYQMTTRALTESSEFVERTLKSVQWGDLETELLQAKAKQQSGGNSSGIDAQAAEELLTTLARLKAQQSDKE
jgi:hypothetical protein